MVLIDARTLLDHARVEAQNHRFTYDEVSEHILRLHGEFYADNFYQPIGVEAVVNSLCDLALAFGEAADKDKKEKKMSRPFGVSILLAGYDENGARLFFSDPSGTYVQYKAKAIGAGSEGAQSTLQDKYRDDFTLRQAEDLALEVLKQVMEEKIGHENIEIASVTAEVSSEYALYFT